MIFSAPLEGLLERQHMKLSLHSHLWGLGSPGWGCSSAPGFPPAYQVDWQREGRRHSWWGSQLPWRFWPPCKETHNVVMLQIINRTVQKCTEFQRQPTASVVWKIKKSPKHNSYFSHTSWIHEESIQKRFRGGDTQMTSAKRNFLH